MNLVVGLHHHRHGVDIHVFDVSEFPNFSEDDFIDYLGEEFEREREEWVEFQSISEVKKLRKRD